MGVFQCFILWLCLAHVDMLTSSWCACKEHTAVLCHYVCQMSPASVLHTLWLPGAFSSAVHAVCF